MRVTVQIRIEGTTPRPFTMPLHTMTRCRTPLHEGGRQAARQHGVRAHAHQRAIGQRAAVRAAGEHRRAVVDLEAAEGGVIVLSVRSDTAARENAFEFKNLRVAIFAPVAARSSR